MNAHPEIVANYIRIIFFRLPMAVIIIGICPVQAVPGYESYRGFTVCFIAGEGA